MHTYVNKKLPSSFNNFFVELPNFNRSQTFQLEILKRSNLKFFTSYAIPKLWNELPLSLKRIVSLKAFKTTYTNTLIASYSTPCTVTNCYSCRK